jgi:hypothetical protein
MTLTAADTEALLSKMKSADAHEGLAIEMAYLA